MNWTVQGNCVLSLPYRLFQSIHGWEVWLRTKDKYGVLARGLSSLNAAKAYAERHKAQQSAPA